MADSEADLLLRLTADNDATDEVTGLEAALQAFARQEYEASVDVDTADGQAHLAGFVAACEAVDGKEVEVSADVDFSQLDLFTQKLEDATSRSWKGSFFSGDAGELTQAFDFQGSQMELDVDTEDVTAAVAQLSLLEAAVVAVDGQDVDIDVDVGRGGIETLVSGFRSIIGVLGNAKGAVGGFGSALQGIDLSSIASEFTNLTVNIGSFGARLGPAVAGVLLFVSVMGTALVGALSAAAAGLAAAAVFAGGLAVAFGATLLPLAAALLPVLLSVANVMKVLQAESTEAATATEDKAKADHDALIFARQRQAAETNLTHALQDQANTQRASGQQIADARRAEQQATQSLRDATVSAYREMADAIENAADAALSLERAKLSADQAELGVKEAKAALKDFRKETGLVGDSFDDMFKKFTDVDFKGNAEAIVGQMKGIGGTDLGGDKQLELQRLVLNVRDAYLRQKEAADGVSDATTNLGRATERAGEFQSQGIRASDNYKAALERVADARRTVTRVEQNAAQREFEAANRVKEARKALENLADDRKYAVEHSNIQKSESLTRNLTDAERNLLGAVKEVWEAFKDAFGGGTQSLINGLAGALRKIPGLLDKLKPSFGGINAALGQGFTNFFDMITGPEIVAGFTAITNAATLVAPLVGTVFGSLAKILLDIAVAALPFMIVALETFSGALQTFATGTGATGFRDLFTKLQPVFNALLGAGMSIATVLFNFMVAVAPYAEQLFTSIKKTADKFNEWMQSEAGQAQIKSFFETVVPLARKFGTFILKVVEFFIRLMEVFAPVAQFIIDTFNTVLDIVNTVLHVLSVFSGALSDLEDLFVGTFQRTVEAITGFIDDFVGLGKQLIQGFIEGVKSMAGDAVEAITDIPGQALDSVKSGFGIFSPSKVFMEVGHDLGKGLQIGIEKSKRGVRAAATASLVKPAIGAASASGGAARGRAGVTIEQQHVNLPPAPGHDQLGDPRVQADLFAREMARRGDIEVGAPA